MSKINKRILITGATGDIGGSLCPYLASKGYSLVLASKTEDKLKAIQVLIKDKYDVNVDYAVIDFTDENSYTNLIDICSQGLHGLILMPPKISPTFECFPSPERWTQVFNDVFINPLSLIKNLIPYFDKSVRSKIVIMSGISSIQALMHYATSNVIRTAWLGQTKTLALYYADKGIHFNTLSLGGVMTNTFKDKCMAEAKSLGISYENLLEQKLSNVPLKKYASLNDVNAAVEGLLSDFTNHITGSNFICDGGFIRVY